MNAPGWYPDPNGQPYQRWWDGSQWTDQTQAPAQQPPPQPGYAGAQQPYVAPMRVPMTPEQAKQWAMFSHLSALVALLIGLPFVGPLIIYLTKKDEDPFVADQSREALNFQLTLMIAFIVSFVLCFVIIGFILLPIVFLWWVIFTIVGAVQANNGTWYRYPLTFRFITN